MYTGQFASDIKQEVRTSAGVVVYSVEHVAVGEGAFNMPTQTSRRSWCLWKPSFGAPPTTISTICWYRN